MALSFIRIPDAVHPKTPEPWKKIFKGYMLKLVSAIPVRTKAVLIHLRYVLKKFFIKLNFLIFAEILSYHEN